MLRRWIAALLLFVATGAIDPALAQSFGNTRGGLMSVVSVTPPALTFSNDFRLVCLPTGFTYTISGPSWEYNSGGTLTAYTTNQPMCPAYYNGGATNFGLGMWPARTNSLFASEVPANQIRTTAAASTRVTSVVGSGSLIPSGGAISCGSSATQASPCVYQNTLSQAVTYTASGSMLHIQDEVCIAATVTNCAPSAPIVTTVAAVARAAGVLNAPISAVGVKASSGTLLVRFLAPHNSNLNTTIGSISVGSSRTGVRMVIRNTDQKVQVVCENAGVAATSATTAAVATSGTVHAAAFSYDGSGMSVAIDGLAPATVSFACPAIGSLDRVAIGNAGDGTFQLQGYVISAQAYDGRISDAQLQTITSPPSPSLSGNLFQIYWYGQSNSVGRRAYPALTTTAPYPAQVLMLNDLWGVAGPRLAYNYLTFGNIGFNGVIPAFEANGVDPPLTPSDWGETGVVAHGAEIAFEGSARLMVMRSSGAGSQPIANLLPGTNPYQNMIAMTSTLKSLTDFNGGTTTVDSVTFSQGEADRTAGTTYADYMASQNTLVNSFGATIPGITGQANAPVFYHAQLADTGVANGTGSVISQAQYDIALTPGLQNSKWRLCLPIYIFPTTPADGLHFDALPNINKGEYFGKCRQWEIVNASPWLPLYPTAIQSTGNTTIHTTWHVPVPPLVRDTVTPIQGAAYKDGFQYVDDCILASPSTPYTEISTVTISSATEIDITLSSAFNPACTNRHLRMAYDAPGLANQVLLPTVAAGGSGGVDGACLITVSFNPTGAQAQAQYNATISGGALTAITGIVYSGLYPPQDALTANPKAGVAVSGCSLIGATVNGLYIRQSFNSLTMSAAWASVRDSDPTVSRTGNALYNWPAVFDLPIAP